MRTPFFVTVVFLCIVVAMPSARADTLQIQQSSLLINGTDSDSGIAFQSSLIASNHVSLDLTFNNKHLHADVDYERKRLSIHLYSASNGATAALTSSDVIAMHGFRAAIASSINASLQHGDALGSLVNLVASAPIGTSLEIDSTLGSFDPICNQIGSNRIAHYTLQQKSYFKNVTVGPMCFVAPALGRCGAGGGPDPAIGLIQRFTQQCLNHDQCCIAAGNFYVFGVVNVCGGSSGTCATEFVAAAPGFFFAPDCSAAQGQWTDDFGFAYNLSGGNSGGLSTSFTGSVNTGTCGTYSVSGTRSGQGIEFVASNPGADPNECAGSFQYSGTESDCNTGNGSWSNVSGLSGTWSWSRTSFSPAAAAVSFKTGARPTDKAN